MSESVSHPAEQQLAVLNQQVILLNPSLGWWKGQYQLREAQVSVDGHVADSASVTKPQIKLLELTERGKYYRKEFQTIDSSRARIVEKYSVPFPIRGVRIVPRQAATTFFQEMVGEFYDGHPRFNPNAEVQSIHYRLEELADRFTAEYPRIIDGARLALDEAIWNRIKHHIPPQYAIRSKFYFTTAAVQLDSGNANVVTREDLQGMDAYLRDSVGRQVEEAIEGMIAAPREQMAKAIADLEELIKRGGRVSTKSFNPLQEAIDKIRMFRFIATDELLGKISNLEVQMGMVTPSDLDQGTIVSSGLSRVLEEVQKEVDNVEARSAIMERFGREPRALMI